MIRRSQRLQGLEIPPQTITGIKRKSNKAIENKSIKRTRKVQRKHDSDSDNNDIFWVRKQENQEKTRLKNNKKIRRTKEQSRRKKNENRKKKLNKDNEYIRKQSNLRKLRSQKRHGNKLEYYSDDSISSSSDDESDSSLDDFELRDEKRRVKRSKKLNTHRKIKNHRVKKYYNEDDSSDSYSSTSDIENEIINSKVNGRTTLGKKHQKQKIKKNVQKLNKKPNGMKHRPTLSSSSSSSDSSSLENTYLSDFSSSSDSPTPALLKELSKRKPKSTKSKKKAIKHYMPIFDEAEKRRSLNNTSQENHNNFIINKKEEESFVNENLNNENNRDNENEETNNYVQNQQSSKENIKLNENTIVDPNQIINENIDINTNKDDNQNNTSMYKDNEIINNKKPNHIDFQKIKKENDDEQNDFVNELLVKIKTEMEENNLNSERIIPTNISLQKIISDLSTEISSENQSHKDNPNNNFISEKNQPFLPSSSLPPSPPPSQQLRELQEEPITNDNQVTTEFTNIIKKEDLEEPNMFIEETNNKQDTYRRALLKKQIFKSKIVDTFIPLNTEESPIIQRNINFRNGMGRRSSMNLRGKRVSSAYGGLCPPPLPNTRSSSFYRFISFDQPEPIKMKQLLLWCAERATQLRVNNPRDNVPKSVLEKSKLIQEEILEELMSNKIETSWYRRERSDEEECLKGKNKTNIDNEKKLIEFQDKLERLKQERKEWISHFKYYEKKYKIFNEKESKQETPIIKASSIDLNPLITEVDDQELKKIEMLLNTKETKSNKENESLQEIEHILIPQIENSIHQLIALKNTSQDLCDNIYKKISKSYDHPVLESSSSNDNLKLQKINYFGKEIIEPQYLLKAISSISLPLSTNNNITTTTTSTSSFKINNNINQNTSSHSNNNITKSTTTATTTLTSPAPISLSSITNNM